MRLSEKFIFSYSAIVVLLSFGKAAQIEPSCRGQAITAGIRILLVVLPSRFVVLRLEMKLAQLGCSREVSRNIILAPVQLAQDGMRVNSLRSSRNMLLENGDGVVKLSLLHQRRSLNHRRVCRPTDFILDDCVGLVLQASALDDESGQRASHESANVSPVSHSCRLAEEAAIENFHEEPQRKQTICWRLKANAENQHEPNHLDLQLGEANQKPTHESRDGTRSTKGRRNVSGIEPSMNDRSRNAGKEIEERVDDPAPPIFEDKAREPQNPHVADQVQPTTMQKYRG